MPGLQFGVNILLQKDSKVDGAGVFSKRVNHISITSELSNLRWKSVFFKLKRGHMDSY